MKRRISASRVLKPAQLRKALADLIRLFAEPVRRGMARS